MTNISVFSILASVAVGLGIFVWALRRQRYDTRQLTELLMRQISEAQRPNPALEFLQREVLNLRQQLTSSLAESARLMSESQKSMGERLDRAAHVVGNVQHSLGSLQQATERVMAVGNDIAQLHDILRAPKTRGIFGELLLGDLLAQILPRENFFIQHAFRSGETVDAAVRLGKLVPVDAKFPLENFRKLLNATDAEKAALRRKFISDVKKHIDAIASKYIRPDEGTFDFALMYVPAENVYYETIIKEESDGDSGGLMAYAFARRVVPVSPNSFYAYLQTISLGLRGMQVEQNARLLLDKMQSMKGEFDRLHENFSLLGKHLGNAHRTYEDAERQLGRVDDKLLSIDATRAALSSSPSETAASTPSS